SLLIFAVLWRLRRRVPPLRLFGLYLVLAGIERFLVEFIRRNDHVLAGLSQPQLFAAGLAALGAFLVMRGPLRAPPRVDPLRPVADHSLSHGSADGNRELS